MASIHRDIDVSASADEAWEAIADYGSVHHRVAPGFVVDCRLDGPDRIVTFGSGVIARERLVSCEPDRRRLVYSVVESPLAPTHHQASVHVIDTGQAGSCRLEWTTDVLPDDLAPTIGAMMDMAVGVMARTLSAARQG